MHTNSATSQRAGARRRRPYLITITAAAVSVGLLSLAGAFAQASDTATTGPNRYETPGLSEAADVDLQLATMTATGCGEFMDHLITGLFDVTEGTTQPTLANQHIRELCIRNAGSEPGFLMASAIDLVDEDFDCTGREAEIDMSCGGNLQGELSTVLPVGVATSDGNGGTIVLTGWQQPQFLTQLQPGETQTLTFTIPETSSLNLSTEQRRLIQSDRATWRFRFDIDAINTGPPACVQTDAEPNNSPEQALESSGTNAGTICAGDEDWYRFSLASGYEWDVDIQLAFAHADGDLDMDVFDEDGTLLVRADSATDNEHVTLSEMPPGTYYVRVYGYQGVANPSYQLTITPTVVHV